MTTSSARCSGRVDASASTASSGRDTFWSTTSRISRSGRWATAQASTFGGLSLSLTIGSSSSTAMPPRLADAACRTSSSASPRSCWRRSTRSAGLRGSAPCAAMRRSWRGTPPFPELLDERVGGAIPHQGRGDGEGLLAGGTRPGAPKPVFDRGAMRSTPSEGEGDGDGGRDARGRGETAMAGGRRRRRRGRSRRQEAGQGLRVDGEALLHFSVPPDRSQRAISSASPRSHRRCPRRGALPASPPDAGILRP